VKVIESKNDGATYVGFDAKGRLLIGGTRSGAKWWENDTDRTTAIKDSAGTVILREDGTPLRLAFADGDRSLLVLVNLAEQKEINRFKLPEGVKGGPAAWSLSSDGALLAFAPRSTEDEGLVMVWEVASGKELWRAREAPTELAFAPPVPGKARVLALGFNDGHVSLRTLPDGKEVAKLRGEKTAVQSLAFGRNPRHLGEAPSPVDGLLAVGHSGATIAVWDLRRFTAISYLRGSRYAVYALAFSPDGVTLASAGRGSAKLWDIFTGQLLLNLRGRNMMHGVAFSPDGKLLAVSSIPAFSSPGGVDVYELVQGQGVQSLRGLLGPVERAVFSQDGRFLAAMTQNYEVGLYDLNVGRLLHVLDVPKGEFADNATFAFSPDGSLFAYSAFKEAGLWEVASGKRLKTWPLPYGLVDHLAFLGDDKLLLFRMETNDPKVRPYSTNPQIYPRVCRIRNLLAPPESPPLLEYRDFDLNVFGAVSSPQGTHFIAEGQSLKGRGVRKITAWDALTGKEVWSRVVEKSRDGAFLSLDPTGKLLVIETREGGGFLLVEADSGKVVRVLERPPIRFSPDGEYSAEDHSPGGFSLHRGLAESTLVNLSIDKQVTQFGFSPRGDRVVAGTVEGTVLVYDIREVGKRLTSIGVGW
jgi:WD40 repeat protein